MDNSDFSPRKPSHRTKRSAPQLEQSEQRSVRRREHSVEVSSHSIRDLQSASPAEAEAHGHRKRHRDSSVTPHRAATGSESPLFEPMDDVTHTSTGTDDPAMDPLLKRARAIKAKLSSHPHLSNITNSSGSGSSSKYPTSRRRVEDDPENMLIKVLRQEHKMDWGAIANHLNEERVKRGEPQTMTQPAVYSRFVRNAPRIARARGEVGFDPRDFMHLRHPHHYPNAAFIGAPKTRTCAEDEDRDGDSDASGEGDDGREAGIVFKGTMSRNVRPRSKLSEDYEELESSERTAMVVDAVEVVTRNFWTLVAEELEKTSGRLFHDKAIESRYKAL